MRMDEGNKVKQTTEMEVRGTPNKMKTKNEVDGQHQE